MRPTRRGLLQAAGAAALLAGWRTGPVRAAGQRGLVLCLTGIGPDTAPGAVAAAAAPFLDHAIPLCLVLDLAGGAVAPAFTAAADLARREPGLVEIAVRLGDPGPPGRYFRMRKAGELRGQVRALLRATGDAATALPVVTVFAEGPQQGLDFVAFRSAGFLGLVAFDPDREGTAQGLLGPEQVGIEGGTRLVPGTDDMATLAAVLRREDDVLLALDLSVAGAEDLPAALGPVAEALRGEIDRGALTASRPVDLVQQLSSQPPASLAVLLAPPDGAAEEAAMAALRAEFDRAGVPYTRISRPAAPAAEADPGDVCALLAARLPAGRAAPGCVRLTGAGRLLPGDPVPLVVVTGEAPAGWSVLDAEARLVVPAAEGRADWGIEGRAAAAPVDRVLLVSPGDAATQVARIALARALAAMQAAGQAKLFTLQGFADHVLAPDPLLDRLQAARARRHTDPPDAAPAPPDAAERAALVEDARIAWRYFERLTHGETGLCAGAAQLTVGGGIYATRQATLWDLASQIHGIIAAHAIGIIGRADAGLRIARMLDALPEQQIEGLRLPPLFLATDRRAVVTRGYDFCDTGRFLIALSRAVAAGVLDPARAQAVFDGWDLAGTLRGGHPFEHARGRWSDAFFNHCTPFLARGLAPWGLAIASPYPADPPGGAGDADHRMRLLYAIAHIGPYGAEPPLLEEGELGPTAATRLMAEVLFDAQLAHYEATGQLKCVSETSLHEAPWFTYQGFRLDAPRGEGWVISVPGGDARHATEEFRARIEAVSSKAAYLWAAHYPHAYSRLLKDHIRARARIADLGFSVGVFTRSGKPMPGYSDINTNGIILSAIAHMLRARS